MAEEDVLELPLDLGDEPDESQSEDELLKYLDESVDEDEEAKKEREVREEEDRLQAIVDRKIADRFTGERRDVEEKPARHVEREETRQPSQSAEDIFEKITDDIVDKMATDPRAAVKQLLQVQRTMNDGTTLTAVARANRIAIEQYRETRKSDPIFKAIEKEFGDRVDAYTDEQLGRATPQQIRKALEEVEDAAAGRYYKKQLADRGRKAADPPGYGSGSSNGRASGGNRVLSKDERTLIKMGKNAGLDDKAIREMLRDERGGRK